MKAIFTSISMAQLFELFNYQDEVLQRIDRTHLEMLMILMIEQGLRMTDEADEGAENRSHRCTQRDLWW